MNLGKSLLRIRQEKELTQDEVGRRASLATSYLSRIENGHIEPTMKTLAKLASALDVPITSLFRTEGDEDDSRLNKCPVSTSGACIGEQIRSHHGRKPQAMSNAYGKEELQLLRMTEFIAAHGSKEVRRSLAVVLESLMNHVGKSADV